VTLKNEINTINTVKTGSMRNSLKMQNNNRNKHQIFVAKGIPGRNLAVIFRISSNLCLLAQQMQAEAGR
jgi:hypothetical protein